MTKPKMADVAEDMIKYMDVATEKIVESLLEQWKGFATEEAGRSLAPREEADIRSALWKAMHSAASKRCM